jgi:hypothetical protein
VINHPNGDKIAVVGGALNGAAPTDASFQYTGVLATDNAAQLAMLRGVLTTELHFTSGSSLTLSKGVSLRNMLVTGDGSATTLSVGINTVGGAALTNVSVHGFGGWGITSNAGQLYTFGSWVSASGCTLGGFEMQGVLQVAATQTIAASNGGNGFTMQPGTSMLGTGGISAKGNTGSGLQSYQATVGGPLGRFYNNVLYGVSALGSDITVPSAYWSLNAAGSVMAVNGSTVVMTGATGGTTTTSPALNTVGNGNSYIVY